MGLAEGIGYLALVIATHSAIPVSSVIDRYNTHFARSVDLDRSCWDRVGGFTGEYGSPSDYSLDPLCNWRLKEVEGNWRLTRSG
jgi:hypothetical protein